MTTHITLALTREELEALEWVVAYGIGEKEYVFNSHLVADYNRDEEAEQRETLRLAGNAQATLQAALNAGKAPGEPCHEIPSV